ncbi:MAG: NAD(P)/FAD-dependent oxidoreductase, partial [Pseudonocardiaceae bacterium]
MSFPALKHVVIVGGGLAGARCCEQLRRQGHEGRITLVGAEQHAPYDRPPLSKDVLLDKRDETSLDIDFEALSVNARLGVAATGLRAVDRVLCTTTGEVPYDGLIIATGADPVRLPGDGPQWTVRTLEDAIAVRSRLTPGARVVLIGASWIGAEIASAALARGCEVTCLEAGDAPLAAALGSAVGARLLPWWDGVDLRLNSPVERVADGGVLLADGAMVPADLVVSGVGVRPVTGWLHGSELEADCGVVVDEW